MAHSQSQAKAKAQAQAQAQAHQLHLFFSVLLLIFIHLDGCSSNVITCPVKCGVHAPLVRFPFRLVSQPDRCGYPGFYLTCSSSTNMSGSKTTIQFPNYSSAGEVLVVLSIDYLAQTLIVNDPDSCLPRRFLDRSFSLAGSPFDQNDQDRYVSEFRFLNCSSDDQIPTVSGVRTVDCLSGPNYTVVAVPVPTNDESSSCSVINTVPVPVLWPVWSNLAEGATLRWQVPDCTSCEER